PANAATGASGARLRAAAGQLVELANQQGTTEAGLVYSPQLAQLRDYLKPALKVQRYEGFLLANREHRVLAAYDDQYVGKKTLFVHEEFLNEAFAGQPTVSRPFPSPRLLADDQGGLKTGLPMMYVAAPIRGEADEVIAV